MTIQSEIQSREDEARSEQGTTVKDGSSGEPKYTGDSHDPNRGGSSESCGKK